MTLDTLALFRGSYPSGTRTLYVAGSGVDTNNGLTVGAPKRTIQAAIDSATAGDRIIVGTGVYGYTQFYGKTGTASAWITVEAAAGTTPVIDVSASVASWDASKRTNGIDVQQSRYVGIYGLEVRGSQSSPDPDPSGIGIFRGSHHIAVWGCDVHDFPGGGINCFYVAADTANGYPAGGWDAVDVFFNRIHATSKYSPFNTSGISFYGAQDITTLIDGRYGYRAVGNYVYDVICTVPYTPGGYTDVTDGNGISPDSLAVANNLHPDLPAYIKRGLIEGNVVAACGGPGVKIYNSKNIDVVNNTLIGNLRTSSPYMVGYADAAVSLDTPDAANGVVITGNVIAPINASKALDTTAQTVTGNVVLGATDAVTAGNQNARSAGLGWFTTRPTQGRLIDGVPLLELVPVSSVTAPTTTGMTGYQALATGQRTGTADAGALESPGPEWTGTQTMADYTIGADELSAPEIALTANTLVTVAVTESWRGPVQVIAHTTTAPVYVRPGTTVTVKDTRARVVPSGTWLDVNCGTTGQVALISSGTATVSVTRV